MVRIQVIKTKLMNKPVFICENIVEKANHYFINNELMLRLPHVTKNWGKLIVCYHTLKDWNTLDRDTLETPIL